MRVYIGPYGTFPNDNDRVVQVEIHDYDNWDMFSTLALVILPALKSFRQSVNSYPYDLTHEQWLSILDNMIWAFEQIQPGYDWQQLYYKTGGFDEVGCNEHANKIDEGLALFGQYYRDLWD